MKIVVLDGYTLNPGDLSWDRIESLGEFYLYDRTPSDLTAQRIGNAEIVLTNKTIINEEIFAKCPDIKYIGVLATGYNVVDINGAKKNGIAVTNIPTYGTDAVAQFVFALLLEICHNVGLHNNCVRNGEWEKNKDFCFWRTPLIELSGKTLGIIGYGRIGQAVGNIAQAFNMTVLPTDINIDGFYTLDEVFTKSDIISLHCPLTEENAGFINSDSISKMKDGVILINTARGLLINEHDLAKALKSGKVYAAGIDVLSGEPPSPDNPLLNLENCYITPHIAWACKESRQRLMDIAADNICAFLNGEDKNRIC